MKIFTEKKQKFVGVVTLKPIARYGAKRKPGKATTSTSAKTFPLGPRNCFP